MGTFLFPPLEPLSVIKSHTDFQVAMVKEIPTGHFDFRLFLLEIREMRRGRLLPFGSSTKKSYCPISNRSCSRPILNEQKVLFVRAPDFYDLKEIIEIAKRAEINRLWLLHE